MDQLPADYVKQYGVILKLLKFIGIDALESPENVLKNKITIYALETYCIFTFLQSLLPILQCTTIMEFLKDCPMLLLFGQDIIKIIFVLKYKKILRKIILDLGELWPKPQYFITTEMTTTWESDMKALRLLQNGYVAVCVVISVLYFFGGAVFVLIFHRDDPTNYVFAVHMIHLFEVRGVVSYVLCVLVEALPYMILFNCFTAPLQQLLVIFIGITRAMFRSLRITLDYESASSTLKGKITKHEIAKNKLVALKNIIRIHQKLMNVIDDVNFVFGECLFITMLLYSFLICLYTFTAIVGDLLNAFMNMIPAVTMSVTMYLLHCAPGQLLVDSSFAITEAAYRYLWYNCDRDIQMCIQMLIMRSNKPLYVCGYGYFKLSHPCFSNIMSGAMSYFSLLWKLYNDSEE